MEVDIFTFDEISHGFVTCLAIYAIVSCSWISLYLEMWTALYFVWRLPIRYITLMITGHALFHGRITKLIDNQLSSSSSKRKQTETLARLCSHLVITLGCYAVYRTLASDVRRPPAWNQHELVQEAERVYRRIYQTLAQLFRRTKRRR